MAPTVGPMAATPFLTAARCKQKRGAWNTLWGLVKGYNLSYHDKETMLSTVDPQTWYLKYIP